MSSPSMHVCISACTFFHRLFLYQPLPCWEAPLSLNPSAAICYSQCVLIQCSMPVNACGADTRTQLSAKRTNLHVTKKIGVTKNWGNTRSERNMLPVLGGDLATRKKKNTIVCFLSYVVGSRHSAPTLGKFSSRNLPAKGEKVFYRREDHT